MTDQHPITPPPDLLQQWAVDYWGPGELMGQGEKYIATQAARWGADQELEACCQFVRQKGAPTWSMLRAARRPKPPSLKKLALDAAQRFYAKGHGDCTDEEIKDDFDTIRRALEALPE